MSAADRTEKVLRDIHVLFSKAEPYNGSKRDAIVNKNEMMDLLKELNACMYDMIDEHELSQTKKDKANREMQKAGRRHYFCGFPARRRISMRHRSCIRTMP